MRYARAAWRIFVAWAARRLHLPKRVVWELEDQATLRMFACSLDFEPAQVTTRPPHRVGWQCDHYSMTAGPTATLSEVTGACGCTMRPVYQ